MKHHGMDSRDSNWNEKENVGEKMDFSTNSFSWRLDTIFDIWILKTIQNPPHNTNESAIDYTI